MPKYYYGDTDSAIDSHAGELAELTSASGFWDCFSCLALSCDSGFSPSVLSRDTPYSPHQNSIVCLFVGVWGGLFFDWLFYLWTDWLYHFGYILLGMLLITSNRTLINSDLSNKDINYITESLEVGISRFQGYITTFVSPKHFWLLIFCKYVLSILEKESQL